jgi:hypothetical protein
VPLDADGQLVVAPKNGAEQPPFLPPERHERVTAPQYQTPVRCGVPLLQISQLRSLQQRDRATRSRVDNADQRGGARQIGRSAAPTCLWANRAGWRRRSAWLWGCPWCL